MLLPITADVGTHLEAALASTHRGYLTVLQARYPERGGAALDVAGGTAFFFGAVSPLTHVIGLGARGPVTEGDLEQVEAFYFSRGTAAIVETSPYADPSLLEVLGQRGYQPKEFETQLARRLTTDWVPAPPGVAVRRSGPAEEELHVRVLVTGFTCRQDLTAEERELGELMVGPPTARGYLAYRSDEAIGAASLDIQGTTALFYADSTLLSARRQGAQAALIAHRLREAQQAGCMLATVTTAPGTSSQRNYERYGFRVAYSRLSFVREP